MLTQTDTPALAVWRKSTGFKRIGRHEYRETNICIAFWADTTKHRKIDDRWPILDRVSESILRSFCVNTSLADDAKIVEWEEESWSVDYSFARDSDKIYPYFLAQTTIVHEPVVPMAIINSGPPFVRADNELQIDGEPAVTDAVHILNIHDTTGVGVVIDDEEV